MGKICLSLSDEIDKKLRDLASANFGQKRGALSILVETIIKNWIEGNERVSSLFERAR